jgi:hypothetical protein
MACCRRLLLLVLLVTRPNMGRCCFLASLGRWRRVEDWLMLLACVPGPMARRGAPPSLPSDSFSLPWRRQRQRLRWLPPRFRPRSRWNRAGWWVRWVLLAHTWTYHSRTFEIEWEACDLTFRVAGLGHLVRRIGRPGSARSSIGWPKLLRS